MDWLRAIFVCTILGTFVVGCASPFPHGRSADLLKYKKERWVVAHGELPTAGGKDVEVRPNLVRVGKVARNMAQLQADMGRARGGVVSGRRPEAWPVARVWKPRRYFGRFYLQSPHVRISGSTGTWFFNDYFTGNPDNQWFALYWPPGQLPVNNFETLSTTTPPGPQYVPGETPAPGNLHDTLFYLEQIRYSSRFGGSVALVLRSQEDYEYDLRSEELEVAGASTTPGQKVMESTLWDFSSVGLTLYVQPRAFALNRNHAYQLVPNKAYAVLSPKSPVAYTYRRTLSQAGSQISSEIFRSKESPEQLKLKLKAALQRAERDIGGSTSIGLPASRLVHGFIHSQFQRDIGTRHFVDMIEIADDYFLPHTHAKIPHFAIQLRLPQINYDPDVTMLIGGITASIAAQHIYCLDVNNPADDCDNPVVSHTFSDIENGDGTPTATYGVFRLDDCEYVKGIVSLVSLKAYLFLEPETPDSKAFNVPFSCETLRQRYNNGVNPQLGLVGPPHVQKEYIETCHGGGVCKYFGTFQFESRVYLFEL